MSSGLTYKNRDLSYIYKQDALMYNTFYASYPVRFIDRNNSEKDVFGSQESISLHEPVDIKVWLKFSDLSYTLDRFNLKELPEGVAIFSVGIMRELGLPDERCIIEPDVLIKFNNIYWRIDKVFRQDFIGNNQSDFLHYECVLHRNNRTNYLDKDVLGTHIISPRQIDTVSDSPTLIGNKVFDI